MHAALVERWTLIGTAIAGTILFVAAALAIVIGGVTRPLRLMTAAMSGLAAGDNSAAIPGRDRTDEVGALARALQVFKDNAMEKQRMEREAVAHKAEAETEQRNVRNRLAGEFQASVGGVVEAVAAAASHMQQAASAMSSTAEETSARPTPWRRRRSRPRQRADGGAAPPRSCPRRSARSRARWAIPRRSPRAAARQPHRRDRRALAEARRRRSARWSS